MGYTKPIDPSAIWRYINKTIEQNYGSVNANSSTNVTISTTTKQLIFLHVKFDATSTDSYVTLRKNINGAWRILTKKYGDGAHEIYINFIDILDEYDLYIEFYNTHGTSKAYTYVLGRVDLD